MQLAGHADPQRLGAFLASKVDAPLTYAEVGASLRDDPPGYRHDTDVMVLGDHEDAFTRAIEGLRQWQAHRGAGVVVHPPHAPIEAGTTVALALPLVGPLHVLAACRIVAVVDETDRFGFAYGTVAGHPEQGEEAFIIERDGHEVRFRVHASRPHDPLARLGSPVARRIQRRVTRAYLTALHAEVDGRLSSPARSWRLPTGRAVQGRERTPPPP